MAEITGKTLCNRYQVEKLLGRGGMAEVYLAYDTGRAAYLALKLLHEDLAQDPVFIRRFQREAQTLAKLQHPNIVRFYGLERDDLLAFMLMDYIEGSTLRAEIVRSQGRGIASPRILQVMQPVCSAIHYAHLMGLVHCDIKPANIMLHKNGTILVADFGIARMTESATTTLIGSGTPAYMSPEQALGLDPTPQSDLYALGIVLFEMLSGGERPFTGEHARTTGSTAEKVRWEQINLPAPSLRQVNPTIPPAIDKVVLRCLEKDPNQRFPNVLEMYKALEHALTTNEALSITQQPTVDREAPTLLAEPAPMGVESPKPITSEQVKKRKTRRTIWWALISIVLLLLAAGVFTLRGGTELPATPTQTSPAILSSSVTPTPPLRVNLPPLLGDHLTHVQVIAADYFDSRLEDMWSVSNASQSGSRMSIIGKEYWASSATLHQTISEGQGVYLFHQFAEDSEYELHLQNGAWSGAYKRFGFYGGQAPRANLFLGADLIGNGYLTGNFSPKPDVWYYTLLAVDKQAHFMALIWDPSNESQLIYYRESLGDKWDNLQWQFVIGANQGTIYVDDVVLFSFDEFKR